MKVIFLDIDGVIQPYDADYRFYAIKEQNEKINILSKEYKVDYSQYSAYDVMAAYYDWNPQAISRLKYILEQTNAKIISSTDWKRDNKPFLIRDLLKLYNLDKFWYADNIIIKDQKPIYEIRNLEIQDSLSKYPIDNYVILDDMKELKDYYPNNAVITNNYLSINDMNDCIKILKKTK